MASEGKEFPVVSRQSERMWEIIRLYLVRLFVARRRHCLTCSVRPDNPEAERICLSCDEATGNEYSRQIDLAIVNELGGARLVIPTLKCLETREKHRQIRNRFTGANHKELACQFGYSIPTIYDILRKDEPEEEV
ncbi:MAG: Mor transcription activator family protein [Nitrospirota bacterium]